jgi:hypothetical protein
MEPLAEAAETDRDKNADNFLNYEKKTEGFAEKNRIVDQIRKTVDVASPVVNRNINSVYNMSEGERRSAWKAGLGDSGGHGEILPPSEPEKVPAGQNGEQDTGPVPAGQGPKEWAGGGDRMPGTPPGWLPDGAVRFWTPAEETGTAAPSAQGDMRWAEQADRAFRRDSRRYDGGFYLY